MLRLLKGDFEGEYGGRISRVSQIDYFPCEVRDTRLTLAEVLLELSGAEEWRIFKELSLLKVADEALCRPFSSFGGEQTKALLAAMFLREGHFLLLDEPTNHLDEESKKAIGEYLRRKEGFLLVSHDRELLDLCTDHILSSIAAASRFKAAIFLPGKRTPSVAKRLKEKKTTDFARRSSD